MEQHRFNATIVFLTQEENAKKFSSFFFVTTMVGSDITITKKHPWRLYTLEEGGSGGGSAGRWDFPHNNNNQKQKEYGVKTEVSTV